MISQVHRMMMAYRMGNQVQLLKLVRDLCPQSDAPQWRVLDFLGGHLPEGKDLTNASSLSIFADVFTLSAERAYVAFAGIRSPLQSVPDISAIRT